MVETASLDTNEEILFGGYRLDLILVANWGMDGRIGLTGLEIMGDSDIPIKVDGNNLECNLYTPDLSKLINGENITTDASQMWSAPYRYGEEVVISCIFDTFTYISGKNLLLLLLYWVPSARCICVRILLALQATSLHNCSR